MRPIPVGLTPWRGGADDAGQMSVLPWFVGCDKGSLSKTKAASPACALSSVASTATTLSNPTTLVDVEPSTSSTTLVVDEPPGEPALLVDVEPLQRPSAPGLGNRESPSGAF